MEKDEEIQLSEKEEKVQEEVQEEAEQTPVDNEQLQEMLAQTNGTTHMTFNFTGNYHSIAPKAFCIQHFYGDSLARVALEQNRQTAVQRLSPEEKRLYLYLGNLTELQDCISMLEILREVNEVAMLAVKLVQRGVLHASLVKKSDFVERLLPFCHGIPHLNAANVNAHINRLMKLMMPASADVEPEEAAEEDAQ